MQSLDIYLIQADLAWENSRENLRHLGEMMADLPEGGLVLLPEMFSTGFTMNPEQFAETMDGPAVQWIQKMSEKRAVSGSLCMKTADQKFSNRLLWAENGVIREHYDKRHLFSYGQEHRHYTAGTEPCFVQYQQWNIRPFVCYDLRFPVWCRNTNGAGLMFFVANWPQVRIGAWMKLIQARAIENQCYVAGVNRVGEDGKGIYHNGCSMVCDPWGEIMAVATDEESILKVTLDAGKLAEFRARFPVLDDRDEFTLSPRT